MAAERMKFWFDTEFLEDGSTIKLISIGIVAEDGREYYAETDDAAYLATSTDWLKANVAPHLKGGECIRGRTRLAREIVEFVGPKPEFWAYYADYDWVVLCQLFGRMIDLPKGWPMFCRDVKQLSDSLGNPTLPEQPDNAHDALADARWNKTAWGFLSALEKAAETKPIDDLHQYGDRDLVEDSKGRWWACLGQATEEEARAFAPTPKPGAEPVPVATWRPIETAPKDGAWIMAYWPTLSMTRFPAVLFWDDGWQLVNDRDYGEVLPTHWMSLPAPPAIDQGRHMEAGTP